MRAGSLHNGEVLRSTERMLVGNKTEQPIKGSHCVSKTEVAKHTKVPSQNRIDAIAIYGLRI